MLIFSKREFYITCSFIIAWPLTILAFIQDYMGKDAWIKFLEKNWWDIHYSVWIIIFILSIIIVSQYLIIALKKGIIIKDKIGYDIKWE